MAEAEIRTPPARGKMRPYIKSIGTSQGVDGMAIKGRMLRKNSYQAQSWLEAWEVWIMARKSLLFFTLSSSTVSCFSRAPQSKCSFKSISRHLDISRQMIAVECTVYLQRKVTFLNRVNQRNRVPIRFEACVTKAPTRDFWKAHKNLKAKLPKPSWIWMFSPR